MTPESHYISPHGPNYGDTQWLSEQIGLLPIRIQERVCVRYSEIYSQLLKEDRENARARANTWLRKTVEKHKAVDDGGIF